ncbi:MAG: hypothetical protein AAF191_05875, partial [Verrucomicrobiota bacterium]
MSAQNVDRAWFTPPVVHEGLVDPVRLEVSVSGPHQGVAIEIRGEDRLLSDDGQNGDLKRGDATWSILLDAGEILGLHSEDRVYRPFIGFCKIDGQRKYNVTAQVWTEEIGLRPIEKLDAEAQQTAYV